ncbi:MAG: hypothetical protein LBN06_04735 [Prevotellaceae bacterium]|jgi:hypothetical protein|nr:hypothetical protein [Prevotellaceae bacterium]
MKRTTYIIIGILAGSMLLMCVGIIYLLTGAKQRYGLDFKIGGEPKTIALPTCKVVHLVDNSSEKTQTVYWVATPLTVNTAPTASITMAADMEQYMQTETIGDTLRIRFTYPVTAERDDQYLWEVRSTALTLALPASTQCFWSELQGQYTTFSHCTADTLSIWKNGWTNVVKIEDSRFRALHINTHRLTLESGEVQHLHRDINRSSDWDIKTDSFRIDTEYLYGWGECYYNRGKTDARRVVWIPRTGDAQLHYQLKEPTVLEIKE